MKQSLGFGDNDTGDSAPVKYSSSSGGSGHRRVKIWGKIAQEMHLGADIAKDQLRAQTYSAEPIRER